MTTTTDRHLVAPSCDPKWCSLTDLPVSIDFDGRWQLHQWHPRPEDGAMETRCEHGGVKVALTAWNLSHILDFGALASQRCAYCWTDETWDAMLRLVDAASA